MKLSTLLILFFVSLGINIANAEDDRWKKDREHRESVERLEKMKQDAKDNPLSETRAGKETNRDLDARIENCKGDKDMCD